MLSPWKSKFLSRRRACVSLSVPAMVLAFSACSSETASSPGAGAGGNGGTGGVPSGGAQSGGRPGS
ncbi:MAG TPA: hypothetical protein VF395_00195, partial [Polyangiaceae bacterium]